MSSQRVPAWKRLGLKLKSAPSDGSPTLATPVPAPSKSSRPNALPADRPATQKRTLPQGTHAAYSSPNGHPTPNKRARTDDRPSFGDRDTHSLRRQKSVSFAADTKTAAATAEAKAAKAQRTKSKKKARKAKKAAAADPAPDFDLTPALLYLRQWDADREQWKFNKNHQTLLIKYFFDGAPRIPSADVATFLAYIRDIKGGVRARLRTTAEGLRQKDMDDGVKALPADLADRDEKQRRYEEVIARFLEEQKAAQQQTPAKNGGTPTNKRTFDEVEFVLRTAEPALQQRLIKRIRAELVLEELSDSEESASSASTASSATRTASGTEMDVDSTATEAPSQQPKRRRLRNARTGNVEVSSESSSDSDSDSDSSSSSEEDSSGDQPMGEADAAETSSSSSSSSSEAGDSSESDSEDSDEE